MTYSDFEKGFSKGYETWFNTAAFINTNADTATVYNNTVLEGNLRTYPLRFNNVPQDYQDVVNVGAEKKFAVWRERANMVLRAEAMNALNHPVYSAPRTDPSSTGFGQITGFGNTSRILQFAVEAHF
jgi:hypothetical protein